MRVYICGIRDRWANERLLSRLEERGHHAEAVELDRCSLSLHSGEFLYQGEQLEQPELVLVKRIGSGPMPGINKRLNFVWWWEQQGTTVLSPSLVLAMAYDRIQTNIELRNLGVPIPATLVTENISRANRFLRDYERIILRSPNTNEGRRAQEFDMNDLDQFNYTLTQLREQNNIPFVLQEYLEHESEAQHLVVLDDEYVGAYRERTQTEGWQDDRGLSDSFEIIDPPDEAKDTVERITSELDLFYADIEIIVAPDGQFWVTDLDNFSGHRVLENLGDVPLTERIVDEMLEQVEVEQTS